MTLSCTSQSLAGLCSCPNVRANSQQQQHPLLADRWGGGDSSVIARCAPRAPVPPARCAPVSVGSDWLLAPCEDSSGGVSGDTRVRAREQGVKAPTCSCRSCKSSDIPFWRSLLLLLLLLPWGKSLGTQRSRVWDMVTARLHTCCQVNNPAAHTAVTAPVIPGVDHQRDHGGRVSEAG